MFCFLLNELTGEAMIYIAYRVLCPFFEILVEVMKGQEAASLDEAPNIPGERQGWQMLSYSTF